MQSEPRKSNSKSKKKTPPPLASKRARPGARKPKAQARRASATALGTNFIGTDVDFDLATGRMTLKNPDLCDTVTQFLQDPVEGCFSALIRVGEPTQPVIRKGGVTLAEDGGDPPVVVDARC